MHNCPRAKKAKTLLRNLCLHFLDGDSDEVLPQAATIRSKIKDILRKLENITSSNAFMNLNLRFLLVNIEVLGKRSPSELTFI